MSLRDCKPCTAGKNEFENDLMEKFIAWLNVVTCIPWVAGYGDSASPSNFSDQFGTVVISSFDMHEGADKDIAKVTDNEACVRINTRFNADVELTVFNHSERLDSEMTPGDWLMRVNDARRIPRLINVFDGVTIKSSSRILNIFEIETEDTNLYERRATMTFDVCVERSTSFADDIINGYCLEFCKMEALNAN